MFQGTLLGGDGQASLSEQFMSGELFSGFYEMGSDRLQQRTIMRVAWKGTHVGVSSFDGTLLGGFNGKHKFCVVLQIVFTLRGSYGKS